MGVQVLCYAIPMRHKMHYPHAMYETPYREGQSSVGVDSVGIKLSGR